MEDLPNAGDQEWLGDLGARGRGLRRLRRAVSDVRDAAARGRYEFHRIERPGWSRDFARRGVARRADAGTTEWSLGGAVRIAKQSCRQHANAWREFDRRRSGGQCAIDSASEIQRRKSNPPPNESNPAAARSLPPADGQTNYPQTTANPFTSRSPDPSTAAPSTAACRPRTASRPLIPPTPPKSRTNGRPPSSFFRPANSLKRTSCCPICMADPA